MKIQLMTIIFLATLSFATGCSGNGSSNSTNSSSDNSSLDEAQAEARDIQSQIEQCETLSLEEQGPCLEQVQNNAINSQLQ